ncbi:hypothetical protein [Bacillus suaedaesalsae]|uniref:Uncharacterized protein n=1 Tax=Bacillus suaedaesalsae TaxID=2810349 RepID=A0ABS2DJS9_9BACI|nr:hypothetical protein [Bacillus suaedaesalsae]MBM6617743.1 hypothetical protein [Bacillus suaedaesalsae]
MKYGLIISLVVFQLAGFYFLTQQQYIAAIVCFALNGLSLLVLLLLILRDRLKEKKEEDENDYRDY